MNAPRGGGGVGQMQSIEFRGEGGCWAGEFERILSPVIEAILGQRSCAFRWQMYIFKHFKTAIGLPPLGSMSAFSDPNA